MRNCLSMQDCPRLSSKNYCLQGKRMHKEQYSIHLYPAIVQLILTFKVLIVSEVTAWDILAWHNLFPHHALLNAMYLAFVQLIFTQEGHTSSCNGCTLKKEINQDDWKVISAIWHLFDAGFGVFIIITLSF